MIEILRRTYLPNAVVIFNPGGSAQQRISKIVSYLQGRGMVDGKAAAYVCENSTCRLPALNPLDFQQQLYADD
ncbi:MAG: hypothetical protein GXO82_02165 [Chlorobi bacterium]|nr:hypothetical protein [Chlorobiota bacterium]